MNAKERKEKALEKAQDAFWASIAESYPEIKHGDFPPDATFIFDKAIKDAVDTWLDLNARIFSGNYPTGIVWADRYKEEHGDYKKLAYLNYRTLELEIQKDCPKQLIPLIEADAKSVQDKKGEQYQISGSGQTVTLGA